MRLTPIGVDSVFIDRSLGRCSSTPARFGLVGDLEHHSHLVDGCCFDITTVQTEEQSSANPSGAFVAVHEGMIAGQAHAVAGSEVE